MKTKALWRSVVRMKAKGFWNLAEAAWAKTHWILGTWAEAHWRPATKASPGEALQVQVTRITVHQSDTEAELKCHSSCSPAARLSDVWFKNGQRVTGVETSSFKGRVYPGDIISCALKGHENYGSPPVYAPRLPSVSVSPSAEIVEGSSVNLTCSSDANPAANYTWYKENEDSPKASGQIFTITDFRAEHSGNYYCEVQNRRGRHNSTLQLIVVAATWKLPVALSATAVILIFMLLLVFFCIRRVRSSQQQSEADERPDNRAQQTERHYGRVRFTRTQADTLYSDFSPARPHRNEEESVVYATTNFIRSSGSNHQAAVEDPSALYSRVTKSH
ncbi:B-cell receptor CD22-like [Acanthopagrus schlegelii]